MRRADNPRLARGRRHSACGSSGANRRGGGISEKYPSCIAIGTGGNFRAEQTVSEAQAIKNGLVANGVEPSRVLLEDKARTTYENFLNCKKIIEENAPENASVGILSNTYHLFRAGLIARDSGLESSASSPRRRRLPCADICARAWLSSRSGAKNQTGFSKK